MTKGLAQKLFEKRDSSVQLEELVDAPFEKVDHYFAKAISPDSDENTHLFLSYLFAMAREGHICCCIEDGRVFPEPPAGLQERIILGSKNVPSHLIGEEHLLVCVNNFWYLQRNFVCEKRFIDVLQKFSFPRATSFTKDMLEGRPLTLEQKEAIVKALNSSLSVVCGGPGTGKTRTAVELISLFLKKTTKTAAVCAPTGKATANLRPFLEQFNERCSISTLHALLQRSFHPYDLIIVDEGSMIDAFLMQKLLSSLKNDGQLVIFGDIDQLPPVGIGNFFKDLVLNNLCEKSFLSVCLRAELEEIIDLARKVKEKQKVVLLPMPSHDELLHRVLVKGSVEEMFAHYRALRILTPQRKGAYGVDTLNHLFYQYCKRQHAPLIPIIIKVNDPERGLYNGDFGVLDENQGIAHFEGGKTIIAKILPIYEYGFVLSVHKSQGSEYEETMILLPEGSERFGKEMLYTAVTRARKKATLYGDESLLEKIYSREAYRLSGLNMLNLSNCAKDESQLKCRQ